MEWHTVEELSGTFMAVAGTLILIAGAVSLFLGLPQAYGVLGTGLGIIAGGLGFVADSALREMKRSQVDEKLAVISGFGSNAGGLVTANLLALERISSAATKSQANRIASDGKVLLSKMRGGGLTQAADESEKILNRILKKHHLSV
jgi:hypothetical protein